MTYDPNAITAAVQEAADRPEGISVMVLTTDPALAREAGPELARMLYPGDRFGGVLYVGDFDPETGGIEVVVRVF